ncbi:MAG: hypothetical protein KBB52_06780 [Candidatus Omnitrophica bacterium]|nr:hypothetical protein [Candidatus Omnitrophota bacterium]
MKSAKTFSMLVMIGVVCLSLSLCGCGQKKDELNLPETEQKQLEKAQTAAPAAQVKGVRPSEEFKKFYVYGDGGYFKNHYIPSGWMGDYGDIGYADTWTVTPQSRRTCIRVTYSAARKQGAGWAGIYWQDPANNWGSIKGGFDLTGAKKLTFWARGDKGGEVITEFKMGGIAGEFADSGSSSIGPVVLTKDWKQYTIDLANEDLSLVIGGFCFVLSAMENPEGATFYLDEIVYE